MMKLAIQVDDKDELKAGKMLKKLEYIELPLFEKLIGGQQLQVSKQQFSPGNKYLWGDTAKTKEFLKTDIQQRVTVPHDGQGDSVPYYVERLFFVQGAGLFFIMECNDTKVLKETEVSLKYLEDAGIGTDRAVGNGFFRVKKCSLEIALQTTAMHTMNLSLFCPAKDELPALLQGEPAYLLEKRGGYIAGATDEKFRHLRKKTVYMFTEGSIFNVSKLNGKVLDMRPEWNDNNLHPVYRSGQPVGIPVLIKQA